MIAVLFTLQITAAASRSDSTYSSDAVRSLVERAAARNATMTAALPAYAARTESEFGWIVEDSAHRPQFMVAQQHYSAVAWRRGIFDVHVLAERPAVELPMLQRWMGPMWLVPALYGDGFALVYPYVVRDEHSQRQLAIDTVLVPHPLGPRRI